MLKVIDFQNLMDISKQKNLSSALNELKCLSCLSNGFPCFLLAWWDFKEHETFLKPTHTLPHRTNGYLTIVGK